MYICLNVYIHVSIYLFQLDMYLRIDRALGSRSSWIRKGADSPWWPSKKNSLPMWFITTSTITSGNGAGGVSGALRFRRSYTLNKT